MQFSSLALAHHADDQVETLLLALSRGAGLAGLAAMPMQWRKDGIDFYRPLLKVRATDLRAWLAAQGETWVEDPSNADPKFTRNHIRAQLLPPLNQVFPQFRDTFARSSAHAAQAQSLLDEIAREDMAAMQPLTFKALAGLSAARQTNLLRHWLKATFNVIPSTAQMAELLDQVKACTTRGHQIHIKVGAGFVQRQGEFLTWYNP